MDMVCYMCSSSFTKVGKDFDSYVMADGSFQKGNKSFHYRLKGGIRISRLINVPLGSHTG